MGQEELRQRLVEALRRFGEKKEAQLVRERGEPISNPFFWPDPEVGDVEIELFSLVEDSWELEWVIDDRSIQRYVRQLMWEAFADPGKEGRVEAAVNSFLPKIAIQLTVFAVLVAIEGLRPEKFPLQIGGVKIGLIDDLVDLETAKEILVRSGGKVAVWAHLHVNAPSEKQVSDAAARDVDEPLDLLATLDQRSTMPRGHPGEIRVGSVGFVLNQGELWQFGFRNEWLRGVGYSVDPKTAVNKHPRYRTGPLPWQDLPSSSEFSEALKEAYRRFGHACRMRDDLEAATPLAVSALESLLSDRDDKQFSTAARVILASAALDEPTMWPLALVGWFATRHEILHQPSQLRWNAKEASSAFWSLYGVLGLISSFILEGKIRSKEELLQRLETPTNVEAARKAMEREVLKLRESQAKALTQQYKRELGGLIETWQKIGKRLKPRTVQDAPTTFPTPGVQ